VRTWLVVLGLVIAVLGAALILTLFALSQSSATTTQFTPQETGLGAHLNQTWVVPAPAPGAGSIGLSWTATPAANVSLWPATPCSNPLGFCPTGTAALSWSSAASGKGTVSSAVSSTYVLVLVNPGSGPLKFSGVVTVIYGSGPVLPVWSWGLIALGGLALMAIGGIALFLGLFLPGGVYRDPDAEMVVTRHPSLPPENPEADQEQDAP